MNIARSTFYYRRQTASSGDAAITDRIEAICLEFSGYGYRRVTKQLSMKAMSLTTRGCYV